MSPSTAEILRRARNYPYDVPQGSYCWDDGAVRPFAQEDRLGRTPVLAFGSNRAPERLAQKFSALGTHRIPVEAVLLEDFDVVYAAHITSYGAVPAMLQRSMGTTCHISITWLDDEQLPIMHASEMSAANYVYARLDGVSLTLSDGSEMEHAFCYIGTRRHLAQPDGSPYPLRAVHAEGRNTPGISTAEALETVRNLVAPKEDPDGFILKLVEDIAYRRNVTEAILGTAKPFAHPTTVITG